MIKGFLEDYTSLLLPNQDLLAATPKSLKNYQSGCAAKKVKTVHFFTAGFSETGKFEWREFEDQMVRKARQSGIRIIGSNCLGIYCPEEKMPLGASPKGEIGASGSVGFICQSGGIATKLMEIGIAWHINCSKGVSFGNGIDLDASDFLQYLAADPKTAIIGAYLEGTRDGRRLFGTMKEVAKTKPLLVWKAGRMGVGAEAAMSHTGSLTSSAAVWSAAIEQAGAIEVRDLEGLTDRLLIFQPLWVVACQIYSRR